MVSVPATSPPGNTRLAPSRSIPRRSYRCDRLPPGAARLRDGTPAAALVTLVRGRTESKYLVAFVCTTADEGVVTRWQKPDGTTYTLAFNGRSGVCDCPACCWEAVERADRRHRTRSGSLGCTKLDALAAMAAAELQPLFAAHAGLTDDLPF